MLMPIQEREGVGRRERDQECLDHEKRMDKVDLDMVSQSNELSKQSGWLKASALLVLISMATIGGLSNMILTRLTSIDDKLNANNLSYNTLNTRFEGLVKRVDDLEERQRFYHDSIKGYRK